MSVRTGLGSGFGAGCGFVVALACIGLLSTVLLVGCLVSMAGIGAASKGGKPAKTPAAKTAAKSALPRPAAR